MLSTDSRLTNYALTLANPKCAYTSTKDKVTDNTITITTCIYQMSF